MIEKKSHIPPEAEDFKIEKEKSEISDAEFCQEAKEINEQINNYINTVEEFNKSKEGSEISKNASDISNILHFINSNKEKTFKRTINSYKSANMKYDESAIKEQIESIYQNGINKTKKAIKNLFPKRNIDNLDKKDLMGCLSNYLELNRISSEFNPQKRKVSLNLKGYPIEISQAKEKVRMVNVNENKIDFLDKMYKLILDKFFSQLPKNSVLIYPAIGSDRVFCDEAVKYDHKVVAIDNQPNTKLKLSNVSFIEQNFEDYKQIKEKLENSGELNPDTNIVFVVKGFDTIDHHTNSIIQKIIKEDFDGNQMVLFGCGYIGGQIGSGIPYIQSDKYLDENKNYQETTQKYFDKKSLKLMSDITDKSNQLEWTSGFFPASEIKIYNRLK